MILTSPFLILEETTAIEEIIFFFIFSLILFNINSNGYASFNYSSYTSLYPSIYENITYRSWFDAKSLSEYNFTTPFISSTYAYVATYSNIVRFKMFYPAGAEKINISIVFDGWWATEYCHTGVTIKYWTGSSIKPEKAYSGNITNFWNGKEYFERIYTSPANSLLLGTSDLNTSKWIYFEIDSRECPSFTTNIYHMYNLNLEKYSTWYNYVTDNNLWQDNGDPPYDDEIVIPPNDNKTNISISAPESVDEGKQLVYTLSLPADQTGASDFTINYEISGTGGITADDFSSLSNLNGSIQVKANDTTPNKTILTLNIKEDLTTDEGNETLSVKFETTSSDYKITTSTITTTINDTSKADDPVEPDKFVDIAPVEKAFEIISQTIKDGKIEFSIKDQNQNSGTKDSGQFDIAYYLVKSAQQPTIDTIYNPNSIPNSIPDSNKLELTNSDGKLTRTISNIVAGTSESINDYKLTAVSVPRFFFDLVEDEKIWAVKVIDLDFKISESNNTNDAETNNIDSFEYQVELPDLHVDEIEAESQEVTAGEDLNVSAHISNSGTAPAQNVIVDFFIVAGNADVNVNDFIKKKSQYIADKTGLFAEFPDQKDANLPKVEYTDKSPIVEKLDYETNNNTASVNATIPSSIYSKYNGSFRILAVVNSNFKIPESNTFNNFAKDGDNKLSRMAENDGSITWLDISGASADSITVIPEIPNLEINSLQFKGKISKFPPNETVIVQYQLKNSGADFRGSPDTSISVYLSKFKSEDQGFDAAEDKDNKLKDDDIPESITIENGKTYPTDGTMKNIELPLNSLYSAGKYYVFVVLNFGDAEKPGTGLEMDIVKMLPESAPAIVIPADDNDPYSINDDPVYFGITQDETNSCISYYELKVQFPAYTQAVDHYIVIQDSDSGRFYLVQDNDRLFTPFDELEAFIPCYSNAENSTYKDIITKKDIDICNELDALSRKSKYYVYWLTSPHGTLAKYDFGSYTVEMP